MLSVKTNLLAANADRQLKTNTKKNAKYAEKLSSGYRINRAADDAAGLAISEKMRRQIRGLHQSVDNINDGIGYVQTAEGALNEVHDMLQRINELAVKSANGTNTEEDRSYIDSEVQAIKKEMDRIFTTTEFNERRIWEPSGGREIIGYDSKQAVTFNNSIPHEFDVTNKNYGVIAYENGYTIHADKAGVSVSWTGYNGTDYSTEKIDWDTLKKKNYAFDMSDYFGGAAKYPELYDNGKPVFSHDISFSVAENAIVDDIIACINGVNMYASAFTAISARFEDKDGNERSYPGVSIIPTSMFYGIAYASRAKDNVNGHDFDAVNDNFFEPAQSNTPNITENPIDNNTTVSEARKSNKIWSFQFDMKGIGIVTATSETTYYSSYDRDADDEGFWWSGNFQKIWASNESEGYVGGTLGSVMAALTGTKTDKTPGLLAKSYQDENGVGGASDNGGYIDLGFDLKGASYQAGKDTVHGGVGFFVRIQVYNTDTEQTVLDRISNALNADTIIDFYTTSVNKNDEYAIIGPATANLVNVPIYGEGKDGTCNFFVQAGAEAGQHIDIEYESLSLAVLGLTDTNVLTAEDSDAAINEIKNAMQIVSKQRSDFGAYQNRLEHAVNINRNVEENTQAAESLIRDTDIAEMMMEYSVNNILLQAGTSMLTQANQSKQLVLELLN